jgi:hypothetical protein
MEVVVGFSPNLVAVLDHGGIPMTPWPLGIGTQIGNKERLPSVAVGNILGDGAPEIIVADGAGGATVFVKVYSIGGTELATWNLEYQRNYTYDESGVRSPVTIVDADGNGGPEVVHGTDLHHVVMWDPAAGEQKPGWPIVVRESVRGRVTISDIDNLGKNEVVASDLAGLIHVWDYRDQLGVHVPPNPLVPLHDQLGQNWPNPFNPTTTIPVDVSKRGDVSVRAYSPAGRLVREIVTGVLEAGRYEVQWDGQAEDGAALPSGVYIIEFRARGELVGSQKLLLLR